MTVRIKHDLRQPFGIAGAHVMIFLFIHRDLSSNDINELNGRAFGDLDNLEGL